VYENYVVPYPNLMLQYLGKPLIVVFDGSGANHSDFTHPNFTIRWMASQLQDTGFEKKWLLELDGWIDYTSYYLL